MTTIVYDHKKKQIACDGRILNNGCIRSEEYEKFRQTGKGMMFFAGSVADINLFIKNAGEDGSKIPIESTTMCLRVDDSGVYECAYDQNDGYYEVKMEFNAALGSGQDWALAALDYGKSAREAVEYAKTKDTGTGGKVFVFDVDNLCFID